MRPRNAVAFHQILREQKISHRGQDRDEENTDGALTLIQQPLHQHQRAPEIAGGEAIPRSENNAGAGERNEFAHQLNRRTVLATLVEIDLLQLVLDLASIAAGKQDKEVERVLFKLQLPRFRSTSH